MRSLIKFSSSLFIFIGVLSFIFGTIRIVMMLFNGSGAAEIVNNGVMALVVGSAVILSGGTAFMLVKIDERLERAVKRNSKPTHFVDEEVKPEAKLEAKREVPSYYDIPPTL